MAAEAAANAGTPGVTGFVGAGTKPVPLSQPEVDRILHHGSPAGAQAQKAQVEFSLGESVKVTSGPLSDFDGETSAGTWTILATPVGTGQLDIDRLTLRLLPE